ncbi:MAG: exodeoxyribonuclease III [Pseudomonadota bacterium]
MKKIISWNVNGLRACAKKGMFDFLAKEKPDIFAIQEIKATHSQVDSEHFYPKGYDVILFPAQKAGYSGVGVYIKDEIKHKVEKGLGAKEFDNEGRSITIEMPDFVFIAAYFPNSQGERARLKYKLSFCKTMKEYTDSLTKKGKKVLLSGDYNIAHTEIDLSHPDDNEDSPGYYIEERRWMDEFLKKDYFGTFRMFNKEPNNYTWWSYRTAARSRNIGWRIDYHCVNKHLRDNVVKSYHNTDILGSDHCPVTVLIK